MSDKPLNNFTETKLSFSQFAPLLKKSLGPSSFSAPIVNDIFNKSSPQN